MTQRISLSLSPTGHDSTRPVYLSPELVDLHVARAQQMRAALFACWARRALERLTLRAWSRKAPCADLAWLTPART